MNTKILDNIAFDVPMRRILLRCGYSGRAEIPADDEALLERLLPKMKAFCSPQIILGELDVLKESRNGLLLAGNLDILSVSLAKTLRDATRVTLYAATIGSAVEREENKLSNAGSYREALLWDSFGSEAAEVVARHLSTVVRQRAKTAGLNTTMRFSPGYGDLPLKFNQIILKLLDGQRIGMEANPDGLLIPRKSTTGFVGWIPIGDNHDRH